MKLLPNHRKVLILLVWLISCIISTSCMKETIDTDKISNTLEGWNPKYGLPVAYGNLSLKDIIEAVDKNGLIKEDKNGLLYLIYRDNLFSETAGTLLPIPSQKFSQSFVTTDTDFPAGTGLDTVKFTRNMYFDFSFSKSDVEIDSMIFKTGFFSLATTINSSYPCEVKITLPTLVKNGVPFQKIINSTTTTFPQSMEGYKLSFAKVSGSANKIPVTYQIKVANKKGVVPSNTTIFCDINMQMAAFSSIYGYLGQISDLLNKKSEKLTLDFFNNSNNYNVELKDPRIYVYIQNSFGVPIQIKLSNLKTYSDKTSSYFTISIPSPNIDVNYPGLKEVGKIAYDTLRYDKSNSNIFDAINTSPHYFYYDVTAVANPLGKTGNSNFFTDTSKVSVDMELNMPFSLKAGPLETMDTISGMDMSSIVSDFSIVKKMAIYNTFTNSIPFDLNVQVYLTDDNYTKVDSLYGKTDQPVVKSGTLNNSTGRYTYSTPKVMTITYDETRAKKLENVKHALVKISMVTAGNGQNFVDFYSSYRLNIAFQVKTELNITSLNQL